MSEIQTSPKSKLKNNELLSFGRSVENKILEIGASELGVNNFFVAFQEALEAYDSSLIKIRKSAITTEMRNADKVRTDLQTCVLAQIRLFTKHFKEESKAAALRLLPIANRFKNTSQLSYDDQTGVVSNLIQLAESDTYKNDFALLGLTEWMTELKSANLKCDELTNARRDEKGERNSLLKIEQTRPAFCTAYDKLVSALNANALLNGDGKYLNLFAWWNAMIDEYRVIISLRYGKGEGGQTDNGSSNQPSTDTGGNSSSDDDEMPDEL